MIEMEKKNLILGLDIGITSVGWGIIDSEHNVIDAGVRLFEESDASNNETRRTKRGARRLKRRRQQRIIEMKRLLKDIGLLGDDFIPLRNPYEIRVRGLTEKLNEDELSTALLHIVKRRGSTLDIEDYTTDDKEEKRAKDSLKNNSDYLKQRKMHVCELQLERLKEDGNVRGHNNIFKTEDYVAEIRAILQNQEISEENTGKIIELIERKRHYAEGPGSSTAPTPYGRYRIDETTGEVTKVYDSLIEAMRGKCPIYEDEFRAPARAYSSELFNLLNDLNNLSIAGETTKLTEQQKTLIIDEIKQKGYLKPKINPPKALGDLLGILPEKFSGFRQDTKANPIITDFKGYQKFMKAFKTSGHDVLDYLDDLDRLAEILSGNKLTHERKSKISSEFDYPADLLENLAALNGFETYHRFSLKAIKEMNIEMLQTSNNQMQIITDNQWLRPKSQNRLTLNEEAILSPVAKRAHREALKVIEKLQETYGVFNKIVIETTRDKNSREQRKNIQKMHDRNRRLRMDAEELVKDSYGESVAEKLSNTKILKLRLYKEQDGKCAYTYEPLDLKSIVSGEDTYEIDHIIPYSISLDNSYNNKVLCLGHANQIKGNKSPFVYFKSGKAFGPVKTYETFKSEVLANKNYSKAKKGMLLKEDDISKYENLEEFTARNLVDTSYAVRSLMGTLKGYFKTHDIPTTVLPVRGKVTNMFRGIGRHAFLKAHPHVNEDPLFKDREKHHHHAIDALIAARLSEQKLIRRLMRLHHGEEVDMDTGEILYQTSPDKDGKLIQFVKNLAELNPEDFKFSWKVDKKPNRSFSDETIYSTRNVDGKEMVVKKYKDIYELEQAKLEKILITNKEKLLVYRNDEKTFDKILKAYQQYKHEKKPLLAFKTEHGPLTKYTNKGAGPIINNLKYLDKKLGSHVDITHKYETDKKRVVLQQISPYRTDFYLEPDGTYKFLTIRYADLKLIEGRDVLKDTPCFEIDEKLYQKKKQDKKISDKATFLFSFNRNEIIRLTSKEKEGLKEETWRFIATSNDVTNSIEVKSVAQKDDVTQVMKTIGRKTSGIEKFSTDSVGNKYKIEKETLKLRV